jgi:hypothetical protein
MNATETSEKRPKMARRLLSFSLGLLSLALVAAGPTFAADKQDKQEDNEPPPLVAPDGVTALSGRVVTTDGQPIVNASVRDGLSGTRTDAEGGSY